MMTITPETANRECDGLTVSSDYHTLHSDTPVYREIPVYIRLGPS